MPSDLALWRLQRHTALAALPLVLAHVVLQYWVFGIDNASFEAVSARVQGGVILALDVVLLGVVSLHAFLGLRAVLQDHAKSPAAVRRITVATLAASALVFAYGLVALFAFL